MTRTSYDVIVIGSGPTGGYAAMALSAAGLRVLVLDAGRGPRYCRALAQAHGWRRRVGYKIEEDPLALRRQPIQSQCYAWAEHPSAFVDDTEAPYATEAEKPFSWIRSWHLGGRMVVKQHGLQFYRFSDRDLRAGEFDGASASWPISYNDLEPYYDRVERWLRVFGTSERLPQLPDSVLAGARHFNAGEGVLRNAISARWPEQPMVPGRTAAPALPIFSASRSGRCTVRSNAIVRRLLTDKRRGDRLRAVEFIDRRTRREHCVSARAVILCASAIESARLLLASANDDHPNGLANSADVVGRYLMDHTHLMGIHATMPLGEPVAQASWSYIPCFASDRAASNSRFVRGYGVQVFTMWRECSLTMFGEMLPNAANRVTLDANRTDAFGVPLAKIDCAHGANELAMAEAAADRCVEMLEAAKFEITRTNRRLSPPGLAAHEVGTVRMGTSPQDSALNSFCQAWDITNLFVMDGACFVTQGAQNPTLTMMAIAARSCDYLIDLAQRGELHRHS